MDDRRKNYFHIKVGVNFDSERRTLGGRKVTGGI